MKFAHIGIACNSIEEEIENIKKIHKINSISDIIFDEKQSANLCMLNIEDGLNIELISGKIVENIVKKGIKYYHLCYEVENIEEELQRMGNDIKPISEIKEAILFDGRKVIFVIASYGLIELVEKK